MVKAKVFIFVKQFDGFPKETDLQLIEEELPPLKDGEFLAEAVYLSVDPYMRAYAATMPLGKTLRGGQVAKIIDSRNSKYPVGKHVVGMFGWRSHTISDGKPMMVNSSGAWIVPDIEGVPLSYYLGILGMPGNTAYFGFLEICQPKPGETVVVTGAAGAVGSIVGQIAKIKGCKVIGIAGTEEKGKWITEELGFDHFINYKDSNFEKKLETVTPKGVDCYFDNVGGEISSIIMSKMNTFGRVSVCGAISQYNDRSTKVTPIQWSVVGKQLKVEGFLVNRWLGDPWWKGIQQNTEWLKQGKLKYKETVTEGFENMFKAFVDMLKGGNIGKAVVKV